MRRLILFAKRAEAGKVKTRLTPPLTPDQAVRLYRGFVADGLAFIRQFENERCRIECCTDRLWRDPVADDIPMTLQCPGDLGARMLEAFRRASGEGPSRTVILGADAPTLPSRLVEQAFRFLEGEADAVITPAEDGGYVLVGAARPLPGLFRNVPWGTGQVLTATRTAAAENGIRLAETDAWYDIDLADDLDRLGRELATTE
jgi:rSAM/selenodomain-associated transferase 1